MDERTLSSIRAMNAAPRKGKREMLLALEDEDYGRLCDLVESGKYRSGADAVRAGLKMLIEKEML